MGRLGGRRTVDMGSRRLVLVLGTLSQFLECSSTSIEASIGERVRFVDEVRRCWPNVLFGHSFNVDVWEKRYLHQKYRSEYADVDVKEAESAAQLALIPLLWLTYLVLFMQRSAQ
jgi:hypothetical protein